MPKDEYQEFTRTIPDLRAKTQTLLEEVELTARWSETKMRGKKYGYQLLVGDAAVKSPDQDPQSGLKALYGEDFSHVRRDSISKPEPEALSEIVFADSWAGSGGGELGLVLSVSRMIVARRSRGS